MSRSRVLLALLAVSLLASACTVYELDVDMEGCQDLSVGEQTELEVFRLRETTGFTFRNSQWNHQSGPGALEVQQPTIVEYTATEPGSVVITWEAFWLGSRLPLAFTEYVGYLLMLSQTEFSARCALEVFDATVDVPVALECETSRFMVEVGPRPVTAFHNGWIEFDTNVTMMAGMDYDISEFELSVGGDDELLAGTLDPRVSQPGDTSQSFSWQVMIDRVTGQDLPVGEHRLEVTVTEESGLSVGTMSCTLPFTINIIQYGG